MNDLETRVLNAIPAAAFEINALLSLLRIEETEMVPTASVSCERRPVLRINPRFVQEHCRSDEHLFLLVMHELHHVLLGHTRLFPRASRAHNVAFDALINSMLVARFPAEAYRSFFLDLYGEEDGALRLLAPPAGARITEPVLDRLHHALYESDSVTVEELFNAITTTVTGIDPAFANDVILLGEHGDDDDGQWGTEGPLDPEFVKAIRTIVEKWPPPEQKIRGRSLSDLLESLHVRPNRPEAEVLSVLRRALFGAAQQPYRSTVAGPRSIVAQGALPNPHDRHAAVARACGAHPLLYRRVSPRPSVRSGRARVYLDVSGSMTQYVPLLYGGLVALREHVHPDVLLFSTTITSIRLADLAKGLGQTTGGTDITCVFDHILQNRVRKALVITDGYVGRPCRLVDAIHRSQPDVRVLLTPDGWWRDLNEFAARIDELPASPALQLRRASPPGSASVERRAS